MRIIPILVVLFISCKNYDCPLNAPESTNTAFTSKNWKDPVIDTRGVEYTGADSASFYYDLLYEREEMLCDLACSVLYIGQDYDEIVRVLGKGNTSWKNIPPGRHIYFNEKSEDIYESKNYDRIIYKAGINASGTNYFVVMFNQDKKYVGCYRIIAI